MTITRFVFAAVFGLQSAAYAQNGHIPRVSKAASFVGVRQGNDFQGTGRVPGGHLMAATRAGPTAPSRSGTPIRICLDIHACLRAQMAAQGPA